MQFDTGERLEKKLKGIAGGFERFHFPAKVVLSLFWSSMGLPGVGGRGLKGGEPSGISGTSAQVLFNVEGEGRAVGNIPWGGKEKKRAPSCRERTGGPCSEKGGSSTLTPLSIEETLISTGPEGLLGEGESGPSLSSFVEGILNLRMALK